MDNLPEETKKGGSLIAGATAAGAAIGSFICPGIGSTVGAGAGAILAGIVVIACALNNKHEDE